MAATAVVAGAAVAADQVTTAVALADLHHPVHLVGPLGLGLQLNSGSAFGLFGGESAALAVVSVILTLGVCVLAWRAWSLPMAVAAGLVLGGALGNLADRLFLARQGRVVDFITLSHWPTFNVADACITAGAVLVAVLYFRGPPVVRSGHTPKTRGQPG